ncbi:MAG: ABC transporter substrate-binding protein [Thermodesulfobacteriota bacterium]|jgi:peptide/nickel transport system substrate-binding protein
MKAIKMIFITAITIAALFWFGAPQASGQVLRIAFDAGDISDLNPHIGHATQDRAVLHLLFTGLVRYKTGDISKFEPDLAEKWEVSKDGLTWTFHLRRGVMVHPWKGNPGYELSSEDVVYSFQSASDPKKSAWAAEYAGMTFQAVDKYTVRITLQKPLSELLFLPKVADYAGGLIIPKKPAEELGEGFRTNPVGTGPFIFNKYLPKEKVITVRNEKFYRGVPKLAGVEVFFMADLSTRKFGMQSKEIDVIEGPPSQPWVEEMQALPGVKVNVFGPGEAGVLHFNMAKKPFDDIRVRRAIAYALSRDEVVTTIGKAIAGPVYSEIPPPQPGWITREELVQRGKKDKKDYLYDFDRNKAKKLLAEAGFPKGITTEINMTERGEYQVPMQNIVAQLREAGIQVKLKVVDHATYHSSIRKDLNTIVLFNCWRPTADVRLTHFYHSGSIVVTGQKPITNFSHVGAVDADGDKKVDSVDSLIESARDMLDAEKQMARWKEVQFKVLDWCVAYPVFIKKFTFARQDYVDWGYDLKSTLILSPQINELTKLNK